MSLFVVARQAGPSWVDDAGAFEQPGAADHASFMNSLAEEGVVVVAGPVAGTEADRIRVLLVASATSEDEVRARLADDPWERVGRLTTSSVEAWNTIVGTERIVVTQL